MTEIRKIGGLGGAEPYEAGKEHQAAAGISFAGNPENTILDDALKEEVLTCLPKPTAYPLTLTKEECLRMGSKFMQPGYEHWCRSYENGEYEIAEDPGKEAWRLAGPQAYADRSHEGEDAWRRNRRCPACRGLGKHDVVYRGTKTNFYWRGTKRCVCRDWWHMRRMVERKLPRKLRWADLDVLRPSPASNLSIERQAEGIALLKDHRTESFFFLGAPGTSKSTFAAALFRSALWWDCCHGRGGHLWRVDGNKMFEAEHEYSTAKDKGAVGREITVDLIYGAARSGFRPVLLVEEIDKRRMTEFAANILFRIANAMDETQGQFIITSNKTVKGFKDLFMRSEIESVRDSGEAFLRRLFDNMNVRDYYS